LLDAASIVDGTALLGNVNDSDGQPIANDGIQNVEHFRKVDLSGFSGKKINIITFHMDPATAAGAWDENFDNVLLLTADGTVRPLYTHETSITLNAGGSSGVSGLSYSVGKSLNTIEMFTTTYYHGDQIGSSRLMTDGYGAPAWQGTFLTYGEEYNQQITTNHYKFTGKERDSETGLDYFGARYYGNALGRFGSADPINSGRTLARLVSNPANLNGYQYANNNPLAKTDLEGYLTVIVPGTWWSTKDWNTDARFYKQVSNTFGKQAKILQWSGGNTKKARTEGAAMLEKMVREHKFAPGEKLNIVTHSHGGNVVIEAMHDVGNSHTINNLVTLGVPVRNDYLGHMDTTNVANWVNVYSKNDGFSPMEMGARDSYVWALRAAL
jgi:RHS repeat-associated protein